jgi:hypothetical protein
MAQEILPVKPIKRSPKQKIVPVGPIKRPPKPGGGGIGGGGRPFYKKTNIKKSPGPKRPT